MNISVVIPVYNVEEYIERCIRSIINQTYTEGVECIIINDCTPDNSMTIVEQVIANYKGTIQFKLLCHENNRGIAAVRNTGLDTASGKYILYIDSDDYCELDMLERMYTKAIEADADIVIADYWDTYSEKEIYRVQIMPQAGETYAKVIFKWKLVPVVWNKLIRRGLLQENRVSFIEGVDMGEDILLTHRLFYCVHKVICLPMAFIHHTQYRTDSYCQNMSRKSLDDILFQENFLINFYSQTELALDLHQDLLQLRLQNWAFLLSYSRGKLQKNGMLYTRI
ncbi:MAG: glycosyltransferase [Bacteroides sp.]|nr:glycosyltransferase [Bacteroides sp.]